MKKILVITVLASLVLCVVQQVGSLRLTSIGWAAPLTVSFIILVSRGANIRLGQCVWLPWTVFIVGAACVSQYQSALDRAAIIITPYFVGAAASCLDFSEDDYPDLVMLIKGTAVLAVAVVAAKVGVGGSQALYLLPTESIAAVVLFWVLLQHWMVFGGRLLLLVMLSLLAVPIASVSRMATFAAVLAVPSSWGGRTLRARISAFAAFVAILAILFALPQVQRKMVYEGHALSEAWSNPNLLQTNGRLVVWQFLLDGFVAQPLLGHGASSTEVLVEVFGTPDFDHPHNDWLRLLYEYGSLGTLGFLLTALVQVGILARRVGFLTELKSGNHVLNKTGALLFIPFFALMTTDNVLVYGAYFGNIHFLIIGISNSIWELSRPRQLAFPVAGFERVRH